MINVVMVEDHPFVIEGVRSMLAAEDGIACKHFYTTGAALLKSLPLVQADVILMDINLPDISGLDLCSQVKQQHPGVFIIALSIHNQPGVIRKMMEQGASGYILKDAGRDEFVSAIKTVMQEKNFFSRSASAAMRAKTGESNLPALTRREKEVLTLIAEGLTNKQIAEVLFLDVTTVDSHRKNMLAKYGMKNTSALLKLAFTERLI